MADTASTPSAPKPTLGLTGLTSNAMALIAPGAFLWLTYAQQSAYGAPDRRHARCGLASSSPLLLCLATAVAYAELSKLYPGAGSSYFFAEQAFLSKKQAFKWARLMKFMVGWASHLYYWVYPGVMVGVTAIIVGYMVGQIFPNTFQRRASPASLFMILFCVRLRVRRRLHRLPGRRWHDRRQRRHQRHSDHRPDHLLDHGHQPPSEGPSGRCCLEPGFYGHSHSARPRQNAGHYQTDR